LVITRKIIAVWIVPVLLAVSTTVACAGSPHGVFVYETGQSNFPTALSEDTSLSGVTFSVTWAYAEPQQHVYNWTQLDKNVAAAAAAGLQVSLRVKPGVQSPNWVYAIGAKKLSFRWYLPYNVFPACSLVSFPLPWDPIYLSAWTIFIKAFAAHYANNPAVSLIHMEGINSSTSETWLLYSAGSQQLGGDVCGAAPILPVNAWQAAGYTPGKVTNAWTSIVDVFAAAFPNQELIQEVGGWGFPPIDNSGAIINGSSGDLTEGPALMRAAAQIAGARYALQNDALSVHWVFPMPTTVPANTPLAFDVMPITGDANCTVNNYIKPCDPLTVLNGVLANARAANAQFVEFAPADVENPALAGAIAAYAQSAP
jgi:hypothetical protein